MQHSQFPLPFQDIDQSVKIHRIHFPVVLHSFDTESKLMPQLGLPAERGRDGREEERKEEEQRRTRSKNELQSRRGA